MKNTVDSVYPWLQPQWDLWNQSLRPKGHAYLLSAPKGIGIEQFVVQAASKALCQHPTLHGACFQCQSCHLQQSHQHPDFYHLKCLEGKKEIHIDPVRVLLEKLNETSHQGGYKVIWIEEVALLNSSAFNALLKTLEEPAVNTLFLLTTSEVGHLPETIKSRCQRLNFSPPVLKEALSWLQQRCPNMDVKLMQRALRLNWGAPLKALAWIEAERFNEERQWQEDVAQLQRGGKTVSQVVSEWLKWSEPTVVFDYFYAWSVSAVRSIVYAMDQENRSEQHVVLQNRLAFQQAIMLAKQYWMNNANKELVLETLCFEWLTIQKSLQVFKSVFQLNNE